MGPLGVILHYMEEKVFDGKKDISACVDMVMLQIEKQGMSAVAKGNVAGNLAVPRREEVYACLNRYRGLRM